VANSLGETVFGEAPISAESDAWFPAPLDGYRRRSSENRPLSNPFRGAPAGKTFGPLDPWYFPTLTQWSAPSAFVAFHGLRPKWKKTINRPARAR
jgi:hypothetical protein